MKWVAIALALLLLASGIFWLGRTSTPSSTPPEMPAAKVETPAKPVTPAAIEAAPAPQASTPASTPAGAPLDAAPPPPAPHEPLPPPPKPKPKTLAELDTGTLIQRAIAAEDGCSGGNGSLDQTGAACAMRDRIEAILNARGFCSSSGSANWQRCAQ